MSHEITNPAFDFLGIPTINLGNISHREQIKSPSLPQVKRINWMIFVQTNSFIDKGKKQGEMGEIQVFC